MKPVCWLLLLTFVLHSAEAMAIEEPDYKVIATAADYEIRQYEPYVVAEVDVDGSVGGSSGNAFRILAGYIFGDNRSAKKMNMTAPVESRPLAAGTSMSPAGNAEEGVTYAFVMESRYDLDSLPAPNDPRIRLRPVAAQVVAALRYSGRWTEENFGAHRDRLLAALTEDGVDTTGPTVSARYNAPYVPAFLRRNEVLVPIDWPNRDSNR